MKAREYPRPSVALLGRCGIELAIIELRKNVQKYIFHYVVESLPLSRCFPLFWIILSLPLGILLRATVKKLRLPLPIDILDIESNLRQV